jgi:hypothetical protein
MVETQEMLIAIRERIAVLETDTATLKDHYRQIDTKLDYLVKNQAERVGSFKLMIVIAAVLCTFVGAVGTAIIEHVLSHQDTTVIAPADIAKVPAK